MGTHEEGSIWWFSATVCLSPLCVMYYSWQLVAPANAIVVQALACLNTHINPHTYIGVQARTTTN
jgi:hypothetical protein